MIALQRILCPVDFSDSSRRALDYAAALAGWYGAHLTVVYIFPTSTVVEVPPPVLDDAGRARLLDSLERFTAVVPSSVRLDVHVEEAATVHTHILTRAADLHADLLVLGTHGRSGFRRMLIGSVTERVLQSASCPVLVVPPHAGDPPPDQPIRFRHIVCAVDFSAGSVAAARHAFSLAEEADAQLLLLHAIEVPPELREHQSSVPIDVDAARAAAEAVCLRRLRAMIPVEAREFCTVETAVAESAADHAILAACDRRMADLVVLGVNHHGAVARLVFGSVAARVTRAAPCAVLVVPADSSRQP